ncbi:MAG TPA: lysozyme inhibitor LprI family protein [Oxalicibacterium sp.]|nr:lysozyme inhibitor LprI family protein [Oxalicibacterium sp.]
MNISFKCALALFALIGNHCAHAEDCSSPPTQIAINACARQAYQAADKQLNQLYAQYRARLDDGQQQKLKQVQRAWIKFRDLSCDFESSAVEGGSAYAMVRSQCLADKTRARVKELQQLASCQEGDLHCPSPQ